MHLPVAEKIFLYQLKRKGSKIRKGMIMKFNYEHDEPVGWSLKKAGYFEGRKVNISDILQMYKAYDYHYNSNQEAFMEKYAGLEIQYNHPIWKQDLILRLNPIEAQRAITMDVVKEYNKFLQDDLLIIGDIEMENMTLFLSEKGLYFTGYDDCLINWGDDFETMLNMLMSGKKGELQIID